MSEKCGGEVVLLEAGGYLLWGNFCEEANFFGTTACDTEDVRRNHFQRTSESFNLDVKLLTVVKTLAF